MRVRVFYAILVGILVWFVGIILLAALGVTGEDDESVWSLFLAAIVFSAAQLSTCFFWARREWVSQLGISFKRWDIPLGIAIGIFTQAIILPLSYLPFLPLIDDLDDVSDSARELTDRAEGAVDHILLFIFIVLLAPLVEEIFFRGFLFRVAVLFLPIKSTKSRNVVALILISAIFAGAHFAILPLLGLFVAGLIMGYFAYRTKRLGISIGIHLGFNLLAYVALL